MSAYERVKIKTRNHGRTHMSDGIGVRDSVQSTLMGIEGKLLLVKYIYLWVLSIKIKFPENSVEI